MSKHYPPGCSKTPGLVIYGGAGGYVNAARLIAASPRSLAGVVGIRRGSLSAAAVPAQDVRQTLRNLSNAGPVHVMQRIRVSHSPWDEIIQLVQEEQPDLLVLDSLYLSILSLKESEALRYPPCDIVIAGGNIPQQLHRPDFLARRPRRAIIAWLPIGRTSGATITLCMSCLNTSRR
jgi:hypothetical protein